MNIEKKLSGQIKLSIIIISFNTMDITRDCLRSIYNANWRSKYEIIVVDNNSQDGSVEMIKREFPEVKLIENGDNKLFAIANNQGAHIAKGDYLLLLNSDTIIAEDNLQKMIDYFDALPDDVICIGPKVLNEDGSVQSCGNIPMGNAWFHVAKLYGLNKMLPLYTIWPELQTNPQKTHRTGWVSGCCMMIPRNKYIEVGGLNENLVFYGEEPEFGYRTDKLGYRTMYYAGAYIIHLGGKSTITDEGKSQKSFEQDIAQYDSLISQTVGNKEAIKITKRTIKSLKIKRLFYSNKDFIDSRISHELKVVEYFKRKMMKL